MSIPATEQSWSTSQLVEYLAVLSEQPDEAHARRAAVECALEFLDAEIGILSGTGETPVVVGLPPGDERSGMLLTAVHDAATTVTVAGFGPCRAASVALDIGEDAPRLLVLRTRDEDFLPDETLLLRGMAWVLDMALRQLRVVAALNERQHVLEHVARAERAIAGRVGLPQVLDTITNSVLNLLGSDLAALYLTNHNGQRSWPMSTCLDDPRAVARAQTLSTRVAEDVCRRDALVRTDEDSAGLPAPADSPAESQAKSPSESRAPDVGEAMGVPVRENGILAGSLVVVSLRQGRVYTPIQEQTLLTFADQLSTALSDAKTLAAAQEALRDQVTGLPNRTAFLRRLETALASGGRVHVFFVDLDRFKLVNDTLGHAAGDDLLRRIGARLRRCLRAGDCLARIGGDEYAVLMDNASDATVQRTSTRMLAETQQPYLIGTDKVTVGVSIGVASGQHPTATSDILHDADTAMYQAKRAGGGRAAVFNHTTHTTRIEPAHSPADTDDQ